MSNTPDVGGIEGRDAGSGLDRLGLRLLAALVVALAAWLVLPGLARAEWSVVGDTVPSGKVIENDVVATGTDVVIDGTINGDLIAVGTTVTVNGPVSGSVLAVGRTVTLNGEVGGSTYVVARTQTLGEKADVQHNVHFVGLLLDGRPGSRIGRDLVAGSLRGRINSQVGRTLKGLILLMIFDGKIGGGTDQPDAVAPQVDGPLLLGIGFGPGGGYGLDLAAPGREVLAAGLVPTAAAQEESASDGPLAGIAEGLVARLSDLLILLVVGGLALWLRPALVQRPAEALRRKPLPAFGLGLLAAALALNVGLVALLLAALLAAVGVWLGSISLWSLALIVWGIGFPALGLAFMLSVLTVLYGTKVVVADLVGTLILGRLAPRALKHRILPLLLGLVLYLLLRSIPILGWAIDGIVTVLGLGAIWVAYRDRRRLPEAGGVQEQAIVQSEEVPVEPLVE